MAHSYALNVGAQVRRKTVFDNAAQSVFDNVFDGPAWASSAAGRFVRGTVTWGWAMTADDARWTLDGADDEREHVHAVRDAPPSCSRNGTVFASKGKTTNTQYLGVY